MSNRIELELKIADRHDEVCHYTRDVLGLVDYKATKEEMDDFWAAFGQIRDNV